VDVHLLAAEELPLPVPGEEDDDVELDALAALFPSEPLPFVRRRDMSLLADALRPDDDVGQLEVDVRKRGQQPRVEPRRASMPFPNLGLADDPVDAVVRQRGEEAADVAVVLGDRVLFPELVDGLHLGRVHLELHELPDVHAYAYSQAVGHLGDVRARNRRVLGVVLALTLTFTGVEVVGGFLTGSLALLADAAHMLSDNLALTIALLAVWLAGRPSTPERSFGYQRAEILAALANGFILVALAIWIFVTAWGRLTDPPEVLAGWVAVVAVGGIAVNLVAAAVLARAGHDTLNTRAALRHVIADALGSAGVLVAALVILVTGWQYADPLAGALIALLVLASSWSVLRDSVHVLLEGTPRGIDARELGRRLAEVPGVVDVHDLHVWMITSGFPALAAHVLVERGEDCHARRRELEELLRREYGIEHTTLQVDHAAVPALLSIQSRR
jgi:cobalt-zinc-cadmium efflux system protein